MFLPQRRSVAAEAMTGSVSSSITQQREQGAASCCSARGAARLGTEGRHSCSPLRSRAPCGRGRSGTAAAGGDTDVLKKC